MPFDTLSKKSQNDAKTRLQCDAHVARDHCSRPCCDKSCAHLHALKKCCCKLTQPHCACVNQHANLIINVDRLSCDMFWYIPSFLNNAGSKLIHSFLTSWLKYPSKYSTIARFSDVTLMNELTLRINDMHCFNKPKQSFSFTHRMLR